MRAVDCWCGQLIQGEDEKELVGRLGEHVRKAHPGEHDDAAVRERVVARGYEPPTGDPPWAY
jgi:predicted small metal-binding protein